MALSFLDLLQLIGDRERLTQNKYILLSGKAFPAFFITHLKDVLASKYSVKKWIDQEFFFEDPFNSKLEDNILFYSQEATIKNFDSCFGVSCHISNESELSFYKKKISHIKEFKENIFFIIFIDNAFIKSFQGEIIFSIDNQITRYMIPQLEQYGVQYFEKSFFSIFIYIIKFLLAKEIKNIHIEHVFYLTQYASGLKKNDIAEFVIEFFDQQVSSPFLSLFNLATLFFQKKQSDFFFYWNQLKYSHAPEFWIYFWINQIWYAFLVLEAKEKRNTESLEILYKKANRWFFEYGVKIIKKQELKRVFLFLYTIEKNTKVHNTNSLIHMESFFLLFMSEKA
jgi:hypothetical protein